MEEHYTAKELKAGYAFLRPVWEEHAGGKRIPTGAKNRKAFWAKAICDIRKRILLGNPMWEQQRRAEIEHQINKRNATASAQIHERLLRLRVGVSRFFHLALAGLDLP